MQIKPFKEYCELIELLQARGMKIRETSYAKARGMTELAKQTGLGRESLYKTLSKGSKPRFETIQKILAAFNYSLRQRLKQARKAKINAYNRRFLFFDFL
ncbi:addiction module antidote protein [Avibacterium paragallinarum]|uniref:addiction module antidote protein n=1 Tax=Avibacterium paragallinarum TaxID=728 RepID=UPI001029C68C|nr:putative addiction module antidote protein [Avibacterium paragallinarum]